MSIHVNADDFGLHPDVNRVIIRLLQRGALTDASAMGNGQAIRDGAEALRQAGIDAVGLHACWVGGEVPLTRMPTVAPAGRMPERGGLIRCLTVHPRRTRAELRAEALAQAAELRSLGLRITHIDSHQHMHVFPQLQDVILHVSRELGCLPVRTPRVIRKGERPIGRVLDRLSTRLAGRAARWGIPTYDSFGFEDSGRQTESSLREYLSRPLPEGAELMTHPAEQTPALEAMYGRWGYDWGGELDGLERVAGWRESRAIMVAPFA